VFWQAFGGMLRITAVLALVSGLSAHYFGRLTSELRDAKVRLKEEELQKERAEKQATAARLSSLESRVEPHFLFNTLNSLSAVIAADPVRAERMVERLARLLRGSLRRPHQSAIELSEEMALVSDYLSLEQDRLGDRLRCSCAVPPELAASLVPPFAVQSLVENSVNHAIAPREGGGTIEVVAKRDADELLVEIRDNGPGFDLAHVPAGHGIETLVSRLDNSFGSSARLEVERRQGWCVVTLHLPLTKLQGHPL